MVRLWLDLMVFKIFLDLNDSMIHSFEASAVVSTKQPEKNCR